MPQHARPIMHAMPRSAECKPPCSQVAADGLLEIYLKLEWSGLRWMLSSNMRPKVLKVRLPPAHDYSHRGFAWRSVFAPS